MAEIWKSLSHAIYEDWINKIFADSYANMKELTDWESKFVDSMFLRVRMKQPISELQHISLETIYVKYTN